MIEMLEPLRRMVGGVKRNEPSPAMAMKGNDSQICGLVLANLFNGSRPLQELVGIVSAPQVPDAPETAIPRAEIEAFLDHMRRTSLVRYLPGEYVKDPKLDLTPNGRLAAFNYLKYASSD